MARNDHVLTDSNYTLHIPPESAGAFRGSNELILNTDDSEQSKLSYANFKQWTNKKAKNIFRKKTLINRLPITKWLPKYSTEDAVGDLVAGVTVGLTVIPQALAYSGIAGLPAAYGLYGSFLGCFVYIILGSCKDVPIGPSAIAALLTYQATAGVWQRAVLLTFLSGIIEVFMGVFLLGFLIDFVSGPVSSGFTSAAALIILASQVKDILGISATGGTFLEMWKSIFKDIHNTRVGDTVMGVICIIVLLFMRKLATLKIGPTDDNEKTTTQKVINKIIWLVGTARNAIIVIVCGGIAAITYNNGNDYFKMIGDIPPGLPAFQVPPFSIPEIRNETTGEIIQDEESFSDMISNIGSGLIVVPLIALLEDISICKAFADGKPIYASQELLAIGTSNVVNSFVQAFPGTGALSRGAVNNSSGVRTPLGGLYTGLLVILALLFLTPLFFYIPKAALAGLIIAAVIFMVEVKVVKPMWRSKKSDLIPGLAAFIACLLLPIEYGILVGIAINVVFILYQSARPKIHIEKMLTSTGAKYLMITPDRCLIFPSVEYVRSLINKQSTNSIEIPTVLDCSHIYGADFTAAKTVEALLKDFAKRNQTILFYNLKPSVVNSFEAINIEVKVHYNFESLERAISQKS